MKSIGFNHLTFNSITIDRLFKISFWNRKSGLCGGFRIFWNKQHFNRIFCKRFSFRKNCLNNFSAFDFFRFWKSLIHGVKIGGKWLIFNGDGVVFGLKRKNLAEMGFRKVFELIFTFFRSLFGFPDIIIPIHVSHSLCGIDCNGSNFFSFIDFKSIGRIRPCPIF